MPYNCTDTEKIEYSEKIVLTESDYYRLYEYVGHWQVSIQQETFKKSTCLFIGNSITDPNEKRLLNQAITKYKHHYAIFSRGTVKIEDAALISSYFKTTFNVEIIWVEKDDDISKFLEDLVKSI